MPQKRSALKKWRRRCSEFGSQLHTDFYRRVTCLIMRRLCCAIDATLRLAKLYKKDKDQHIIQGWTISAYLPVSLENCCKTNETSESAVLLPTKTQNQNGIVDSDSYHLSIKKNMKVYSITPAENDFSDRTWFFSQLLFLLLSRILRTY